MLVMLSGRCNLNEIYVNIYSTIEYIHDKTLPGSFG